MLKCMNGDEVLTRIKDEKSDIPVIIFSMQDESDKTFEFVAGGAHAYIRKSKEGLEEVENTINKLYANSKPVAI